MAQDLLRFIACGSVDDGKSSLLGRLLYETRSIYDDQLRALEADSKRVGTRGGAIDFALLLDGLNAEREQGITIDVAYRYFSTPKRKFIVADAPGHEQYTRNMVTGASNADLAIILMDARKGLLPQTRRHSYVVKLLGIERVVLAINKMDLVNWSRDLFFGMEASYREFAARIGLAEVQAIPISAVDGDNITTRSTRTPWYEGGPLLEALESAPVAGTSSQRPFRMPVQWVNRPSADFRGFAGTVVSGRVGRGDAVRIVPSGATAVVEKVIVAGDEADAAFVEQAVTVTFDREIDVARGDVLAAANEPLESADQFDATLVWMSESPLLPGRNYLMKTGATTAVATVTPLRYKLNVETLEHVAAEKLHLNEIGSCQLELDRPIAFEPYAVNRHLGGFILVDRISNETVAAGMLNFALRRSQNVHWQALDIDKAARARMKGQRPCCIWFTGLSGAGKSTIANLLEKRLHAMGRHTYLLDGDNVRHGLNKDLGFTDEARVENIRRVAEVAKLMVDAGLIVICAFISPFRSERRMARELFAPGEFIEVFVDAPLEVLEKRDPKGLYRKARAGEVLNFTGVDSAYERPAAAELEIDTSTTSLEEAIDRILPRVPAGP